MLNNSLMFLACRSVSKVNDEWFADEENVRKTVGLLENGIPLPDVEEVIIMWKLAVFQLERIILWNIVAIFVWILLITVDCAT